MQTPEVTALVVAAVVVVQIMAAVAAAVQVLQVIQILLLQLVVFQIMVVMVGYGKEQDYIMVQVVVVLAILITLAEFKHLAANTAQVFRLLVPVVLQAQPHTVARPVLANMVVAAVGQ
jgi:hypothetical protein